MTKHSKHLLKSAKALTTSEDVILELHRSHIELREPYPRKTPPVPIPEFVSKESHSVLKYLEENGYIRIVSDGNVPWFNVTHKGLHPYRVEWDKTKKFLFQSVLVPIFVSFATSVLLHFLF